MRRVAVLTCFILLAACGSGDSEPAAEAADIVAQSAAEGPGASDSGQAMETEGSGGVDYSDSDYVEDESTGEFGEPMSEGDAGTDASAPMDDAQGIDPHAEMGDEEYSDDY